MEYTKCINYLLTVAQHEVFLIFSENLSQFGITPGQYGVLACLWQEESLTPKEIATILRVENSTISGVLDRMEKRGLIDRVLNPTNRRSISVKATKEGLSLKETGTSPDRSARMNQVLSIFSPQEKDELIGLLNRMCDQKRLTIIYLRPCAYRTGPFFSFLYVAAIA